MEGVRFFTENGWDPDKAWKVRSGTAYALSLLSMSLVMYLLSCFAILGVILVRDWEFFGLSFFGFMHLFFVGHL